MGELVGNYRALLCRGGIGLRDLGYLLDSVFHRDDHFRLLYAGGGDLVHQSLDGLDVLADDPHGGNG